MLISLATRDAARGRRQPAVFAAWRAALERLREHLCGPHPPAMGELPRYVESLPSDQRDEALADLIAEHLAWSWRGSNGSLVDTYIGLLSDSPPSHAESNAGTSSASLLPSLVEDELLARFQEPHGDTPPFVEFERRFPKRPDVLEPLKHRFQEGGKLTMLHCVGRGGRAVVWRGFDHGAKKFVAIKQANTGGIESTRGQESLAAEARIMSLMDHPGILHVERLSMSTDGTPLLVLPWLSGVRLSERITAHHCGSGDRQERLHLLGIFVAVCEAMSHAHERGVIHGDLKPGNVMVSDADEPVIIDWGMARLAPSPGALPARDVKAESPASLANLAGTPAYMAPEQADGLVDARTDVFGLGAVLYELLTGRPPHDWAGSRPPKDWRAMVRSAAFPSPRSVRRTTPRNLDAICRKAMARHPGDRFPSTGALAQAVRAHLQIASKPWWARVLWRLRNDRLS